MGWFRRAPAHPAPMAPLHREPPPPRVVAPGEAFTPTQPKGGRRRLIGREAELERILQALQQDRAHVVLYSERGRGKTSLANLIVEALRRDGTIVARHTCDATTAFDDLIRGLMRDLPQSLLAMRGLPGEIDDEGCVAALPPGPLRTLDVVTLPQRLDCSSLVCVVDEFDRVEDAQTRTRLADLIKQLSDRGVRLLFLIVGVSENLDQILGQHPSIQRSVLGVHLPLFTDRDVALLITRGGREAGMTFPPAAVARVSVLARGMPYMAQLLGLRLTQAAIARGDTTVCDVDFEAAVNRLIGDASPRVVALYAALTSHGRDAEMVLALRRIASAPQDPWGRLTVTQTDTGALVGGRNLSAGCWERLQAARLLQPAVPGSELFVFAERGLMHHALLLAAREASLPEAAPVGGPLVAAASPPTAPSVAAPSGAAPPPTASPVAASPVAASPTPMGGEDDERAARPHPAGRARLATSSRG